jgi:putative Mg2+ transporter-C (MgtC) family protein
VPYLAFTIRDIDAMGQDWRVPLIRLALAALLGGLVGLERELRGRHAGFRTNLLVCLGCALAMLVSVSFAFQDWPVAKGFNLNVDPARVAYGVMTGVGFLGAGVIIKHDGSVRGLTTAAGLWCVAAIGLACGQGLYVLGAVATVLVLFALWVLDGMERWLPRKQFRTLVVRRPWHAGVVAETVETVGRHPGLLVHDASFDRSRDPAVVDIRLSVAIRGHEKAFLLIERELGAEPDWEIVFASGET